MYPPLCAVCNREETIAGEPVGPVCWKAIVWASDRDCLRCGRVLGLHASRARCPDCRGRTFAFKRALAAASYEGPARELIRRMKARREPFWAESLARWVVERLRREGLAGSFDGVIPVPAHWTARVSRGFNPAELVARAAAKALGIPCRSVLARRGFRRRRQTGLLRAERLANVAGVFACRAGKGLEGKRCLLVDDVITTGATVDACARLLRRAGAASVVAVAVARS